MSYYYKTHLTQIWGEGLGSGKTATAVKLALSFSEIYHKPVYSNFHLSFHSKLRGPEPAEVILLRGYSNSIIVIDEIDKILKARGSQANYNEGLVDEITNNRKDGNIIFGTAQKPKKSDLYFRDLCDFTIKAERKGELQDRNAEIIYHIVAENMRSAKGLEYSRGSFYVNEVCDLYDTKQKIQSDRIAYIEGMCQIIKADSKGYERIKRAKTDNLKKAYIDRVYHVKNTKEQLLLLEILGL